MAGQLAFADREFDSSAISPLIELGAYEVLWLRKDASFKSIADSFRKHPGSLPSDFVARNEAQIAAQRVLKTMHSVDVKDFGVRVHGAGEYPQKLRDAKHPIELLYYRGWWDLVETKCVAVVGTRSPSAEGIARAAKLAKRLVADDFTVVSGLARGIDATAHQVAIREGGRTIAVLGTPLNRAYPKENTQLQRRIGDEFLLVSQVPVLRYLEAEARNPLSNRHFFPARNVTMSALTIATVIVEAGESSGTLYQAEAALQQGRRLFILDSCFQHPGLTWPSRFAELGAVRVRDYEDIASHLS